MSLNRQLKSLHETNNDQLQEPTNRIDQIKAKKLLLEQKLVVLEKKANHLFHQESQIVSMNNKFKTFLGNFENDKATYEAKAFEYAKDMTKRRTKKVEENLIVEHKQEADTERDKVVKTAKFKEKKENRNKMIENLRNMSLSREAKVSSATNMLADIYVYQKLEIQHENKQKEVAKLKRMQEIESSLQRQLLMSPISLLELKEFEQKYKTNRRQLLFRNEVERLADIKPNEAVEPSFGAKHETHLDEYKKVIHDRQIKKEKLRKQKLKQRNFSELTRQVLVPKANEALRKSREEKTNQIKSGRAKRGKFAKSIDIKIPTIFKKREKEPETPLPYNKVEIKTPLEKMPDYLEEIKLKTISRKASVSDLVARGKKLYEVKQVMKTKDNAIEEKKKRLVQWKGSNPKLGMEITDLMIDSVNGKLKLLDSIVAEKEI